MEKEISMDLKDFELGDWVVYELKNSNSGRKYTCIVVGIKDEWVKDRENGTHLSNSFRPEDVVIWEHGKASPKKHKKNFSHRDI